MNNKNTRVIDQAVDLLLSNEVDVSSILKDGGLLNGLTKRLVEKALEAEMRNHLGYDKYQQSDVDNARNGSIKKKLNRPGCNRDISTKG